MEEPDVLGFELEEALSLLYNKGWEVKIEVTAPPRGELTGKLRVVRFKRINTKKGLVTVAHQREMA